ncbi:MAG TPA: non-canonical purine NTP pyrophosphatase [Acidimicrobiales bacterium]|nr:non-canonical purine NTP pyrophosphatase [Acidimicrobiales bacterium]
MRRVLLATGNPHKVAEIRRILGGSWQVEARDPGVEETGKTFEENALLKARALAEATGELALADDSGIEIDALDGAPGVRSARWTDEGDWIPRVLRELDGVPLPGRGARYVCAAAAVWPRGPAVSGEAARPATGEAAAPPGAGEGGHEVVVRATVEGVVVTVPRGSGGFGYDPVVQPVEGDGRTFAEMTDEEKEALSHRGRAFRRLASLLERA